MILKEISKAKWLDNILKHLSTKHNIPLGKIDDIILDYEKKKEVLFVGKKNVKLN